jgi:starvation-inducible DNA-binding protein
MSRKQARAQRLAPLATPTDLASNAVNDISGGLTVVLADMFALYLKTKNFHWHVSGPHFRDYHLRVDDQATQTDAIAERVRKIGGTTLRSVGHIGRLQRVLDNDADYVAPLDMLAELRDDNRELARACAKRTRFAPSRATWRAQVCSRSGSTRPRRAPGFCSRPSARASRPAAMTLRRLPAGGTCRLAGAFLSRTSAKAVEVTSGPAGLQQEA